MSVLLGLSRRIPIVKNADAQTAPDALDSWIDSLSRTCENQTQDPDLRILDSNGRYSYGMLMFQADTWNRYVTKFNLLPDAEPAEYINLINDGALQKRLAKLMIEDNYEAWRNWTNCTLHKVGMPPK